MDAMGLPMAFGKKAKNTGSSVQAKVDKTKRDDDFVRVPPPYVCSEMLIAVHAPAPVCCAARDQARLGAVCASASAACGPDFGS